ncbi:MPN121 family protein [Mycoplasmoides alvi]|uniref:MPN121 family protein n=1 Tax=Mycoplasmoides alvi TaxID=78580 RepID=UPI00051AB795|nr:hypothetical protein [Mycoplasmoides alvi]
MSDIKKNKIEIEISDSIKQSLEEGLKKIIKTKQLPENTSLEHYIQLILSNYVQSSKAMENISDDLVSELKDKLETLFNPEEIGTEDFYKKMLNNFKKILSPDVEYKKESVDSDASKETTESNKKKS